MGNKIWSETWMDLRGYELNVVPSSTAKRFSPMPILRALEATDSQNELGADANQLILFEF